MQQRKLDGALGAAARGKSAGQVLDSTACIFAFDKVYKTTQRRRAVLRPQPSCIPRVTQVARTVVGAVRAMVLRSLLRKGELLVAPGVFDGISLRVAQKVGFSALYMTGYGTVASHLATSCVVVPTVRPSPIPSDAS